MCCWTVPERIAGGFCSGCHGNPETRNMAVLLFVVLSALATAVNAVTWTAGAKATLLRVDLAEGMPGLYSLSVNGSTWLQGMAPAVHCQGQWFRPGAGLTWVGAYPATGSDGYLGQWQALHVNWTAGESMMSWTTSFWYYPEHDSFRFEQVYPDGCAQANTSALPANTSNLGEFDSSSTPSSQFPQWDASNTSALGTTLGYLSVAGRMSHDHNSHGIGLTGYGRSNLLTGQEGGPLALFEVNKSNPATLVLSSMDQFMTGITARVATCEQYAENQCLIEMDVDYRYNDISSLNTTSAGACCEACHKTPGCTCFTYAPATVPVYGTLCWLKSSAAGSMSAKGHVSGRVCKHQAAAVVASGPHSYIQQIPKGFSLSFLIQPAQGITAAMDGWGSVLRTLHNTSRQTETDLVTNYLGYWTDNGGYYYGGNNPTTSILADVFKDLSSKKVPVRYLQLDPYWFDHAWFPKPKLFPKGLDDLRHQVGVPLLLYSYFWDIHTAAAYNDTYKFWYGYENNGRPLVVVAPSDSYRFYNDIIKQYSSVIGGFEVDFLDFNYLLTPGFLSSTSNFDVWAAGMAHAASANNVSVQYCMDLPAIVLNSLTLPAVTNARASEDNFPTNEHRWKIAYTSMFYWPLRVQSFMDVVWSTANQPGNPYHVSRKNVELQMIIATLSAGPVGIGDGVGLTNATLVTHVCRTDGLLLQADKAATPLDAMYSMPPSDTQLWQAHTRLVVDSSDANQALLSPVFYTVLGVDLLDGGMALAVPDLYPAAAAATQAVFAVAALSSFVPGNSQCAAGQPAAGCVRVLKPGSAVTLQTGQTPRPGDSHTHDVFYVSPMWPTPCGDVALLGEDGKFVRVSRNRILSVHVAGCHVNFTLTGDPGEAATLTLIANGTIAKVHASIGASGSATTTYILPH
eukprot:m.397174 g.397174  ORF g.397174 m.397174 type:complete len:909 (+) comp20104_c10_seq16:1837-4563(+)